MISLACALIVATPFHVDVKLGDVVLTAQSFELPIARGALAVQNAKTVPQPNGDTLYFVSNASGPDSDMDYASGPVAHLRTRDMPRGFAILLTPRGEAAVEVKGGVIVARGKGEPTAEARSPIAESRTPIAEARPPMAESRSPIADGRSPMAESRSPIADGRSPMAESRSPIADRPIADRRLPMADKAMADNQLPIADPAAARTPVAPIQDSGNAPMRTFGLLAVLLAAAAAFVVYGKRKQIPNRDTAGIDLIAVKSLGGKQRLAVVDACGDRLLIATSEQGVQLLSKLEGGTGVHKISPDFLQSLAQAEAAGATPQTHVTEVNTSRDLAGLVQLRARRATWTSSESLV